MINLDNWTGPISGSTDFVRLEYAIAERFEEIYKFLGVRRVPAITGFELRDRELAENPADAMQSNDARN